MRTINNAKQEIFWTGSIFSLDSQDELTEKVWNEETKAFNIVREETFQEHIEKAKKAYSEYTWID